MLKHFTSTVKSSHISLLVSGGIFFLTVLFVLLSNPNNSQISNKEKLVVNKEEMIKLLDDIQDNYSLKIEENLNDEIKNYEYNRDSNIELLTENNTNYGYILYNNKQYKVLEDASISKMKKMHPLFDNNYVKYDFIKGLLKTCDFKYIDSTNASCSINVNDFIQYLNNTLGTTNDLVSQEEIYVNITYTDKIYSIKIDYSNYIKLISDDEKLSYEMIFSDINKNDYSEIIDHYKDVLEK